MGLVEQLPSEGAQFKDVLRAIIEDGIRPSTQQNRKWRQRELVDACGLGEERSLRYWLSGAHLPDDLKPLERAFFGSDQSYRSTLRTILRNSYEYSKQLKDGVVSYARFPTVPAFWENVKLKIGERAEGHPEIYAETVRQSAWVIGTMAPTIRRLDALLIAEEARARVFDDKYGDWKAEDDERYNLGINFWQDEFTSLLRSRGASLDSRALVVGIGCGLEGAGIYDQITDLHGLDISRKATEKAKLSFPNGNIQTGQAEDLPDYIRNFDLYISLKTYSSSFFDIDAAVRSASNSLRSGGLIICSVPRGYDFFQGDFRPGLMRTNYKYNSDGTFQNYSYPDTQMPFYLISKISRYMSLYFFKDIMIKTGLTEHYITAKRI